LSTIVRVRLADLTATSAAVAEAPGRLQKVAHLASLLARLPHDEIEVAVAFLAGSPLQGRIGAAGTVIAAAQSAPPAAEPSLELKDVDAAFERILQAVGGGSTATKARLLRDLFARATASEQDFLIRLLFGELRQGALEGVLVEAVARAAGTSGDRVRRAVMLAGALPPVARAALVEGEEGLSRVILRLFQPIQPMLAESAADIDQALADLGEASLEYKLDGARIQVHKEGDAVTVFTRALRDVTSAVPEVVEVVRAMPAQSLILDGEAIALRSDGTPHPFQITMRRFGRKLDIGRLRLELPLTAAFFDCLYVDGQHLLDEPYARRASVLADVAVRSVVPRIVTANPADAAAFFERAIAAGHEGVMAKATAGAYAAGRRGGGWLKVKRARTLDLVVLAAEWGHGRRTGTLSNLHLGARDDRRGGFVMLGKTFKGLTDEMLAWQTGRLLELEIARDHHAVHVRPELVVEIAFNDIQESPIYPGGLALRFARVKRYRPDKTAAEADTIDTVGSVYRQTTGADPTKR
jgi:ATP-dependent DNA ligase I